jgi:dipeptidyl aminopeptidase/acylaminoacyl peptidase
MRTLAVVLIGVLGLWGQKRFITQTDLYRFNWVAGPQIAPDGRAVVFTKVRVNAKRDGYETALWIVPAQGGEARQLTAGPRDTNPQWSPDGKRLAFLRAAEKDGKAQPPQIYLLDMAGGEARALTALPKAAAGMEWSPDGKTIAFTSTAIPDEKPEEKSDVRVITKAVYRANSGGYLEPGRPNQIWTVAIAEGAKPERLTKGEFAANSPRWSPDGTAIYYTMQPDNEPYYSDPRAEIHRVKVASGGSMLVTKVASGVNDLGISPDGKSMAYVGANPLGPNGKALSYSQPDLYVCATDPGSAPRNLTSGYDFDIAAGLTGDQAPPRGGTGGEVTFASDGRSVYVTATENGKLNLKRVDLASGKVAAVTDGAHALYAFSAAADQKTFAVAISTPTNVGDLYLLDATTGKTTRLTNVNEELWKEVQLTEPAMIWTKSFDGKMIQSWVQRPPDFQEGKKYPTILNIHGGPHASYGYVFDHEFQWMAAKGYVVVYPNPRGSTSYGQEFGNSIQHNYPGDDHKDLMAALDDVVAKGWADPNSLGVTGGSGGGVLTNWAIGQTDRFKAAVSQRSIADWTAFWYTADFTLFRPTWFKAAPWEDPADFQRRSPISLIDKVKTPLMLIEGEADLRTPPTAGGEQMFRALKYRKVPTVMVQFPGETHELSRSGKPKHRVERLEHIVERFEIYLKGKKSSAYEVR